MEDQVNGADHGTEPLPLPSAAMAALGQASMKVGAAMAARVQVTQQINVAQLEWQCALIGEHIQALTEALIKAGTIGEDSFLQILAARFNALAEQIKQEAASASHKIDTTSRLVPSGNGGRR